MDESTEPSVKSSLPVILIAALVQGWGLYGLHRGIAANHLTANGIAWITALYAAVVFGPLSVQLLARYVRLPLMWGLIVSITVTFFYFGWHAGATRLPPTERVDFPFWDFFAFAVPLTVLWLLLLPFVQGRLEGGSWRIPYRVLFANAWRNKLVLAEAALFTGLFWLLLELWQALFGMLRVGLFSELFAEPMFVYPITALTFGIALHLIGAIDRLTSVVLEQLLNVLKWLAIVAGSLLLLFTIVLALRLAALVFTGEHAIGAAWLLWLVAVIVLLLNAAFRDGSVDSPYPQWIAMGLRFVVPLLMIIAITAMYALTIRVQHYGLTVQRIWALVVASILLIYSMGYSIAACRRGPWMGTMARVNVWVAIVLMLIIALTLTPAMAPERLAANSQFKLILSQTLASQEQQSTHSAYKYLKFDSGTYGLARLKQLTAISGRPDADRIRRSAEAQLAMSSQYDPIRAGQAAELRDSLKGMDLYPAGRTLEPALLDVLVARQQNRNELDILTRCLNKTCAGVFVDLNGDGVDEFMLLHVGGGWIFEHRDTAWVFAATTTNFGVTDQWDRIRDALQKGDFAVRTPRWNEISIGGRDFRIEDQ